MLMTLLGLKGFSTFFQLINCKVCIHCYCMLIQFSLTTFSTHFFILDVNVHCTLVNLDVL